MLLADCAREATDLFGTHGSKPELLPTGISQVDEVLGGLLPGSTAVVGARHRVGKSSLALQAAMAATAAGCTHGILTLEDPPALWGVRALAYRAGVPALDLMRGSLSPQEVVRVQEAQGYLSTLPVPVRSGVGVRGPALTATLEELADAGCRVVHVDYAQKWGAGTEPRHSIIQSMRACQAVAVARRMALMVYSQLTPRIKDYQEIVEPEDTWMRECGDLAREARLVVLYWLEGGLVYGKIASATYGDVAGKRWALRRERSGLLVPATEELRFA